ncbi:MAG TPA: DUF1444 family protein [Sporolactobacillaceae bacterium]|nr:DUF1444 family protein [Sporolactobacillaceae bacterium]
MEIREMVRLLGEKLDAPDRRITFQRKEDKLRVENTKNNKGVTLSLPGICARYEEEKEKAIEEVVYYVNEAIEVMGQAREDENYQKRLFPVMRSTSFPTTTPQGTELVTREHTAETRIYYALDMGQSYKLIDQPFLETHGLSTSDLDTMAKFNLRSLPNEPKRDEVAGNFFYFINSNDGYDASRILNQALIDTMRAKVKGTFACAIPHQDVLIFADIRNNKGYDVLGQMAMHFFTNGNIPITSLSFLYEEGTFRPIFIL